MIRTVSIIFTEDLHDFPPSVQCQISTGKERDT